MIKNCQYCEKPLQIPDALESNRYTCPYDDCSKTFFFDKDTGAICKVEEPTEKVLEDGERHRDISGLLGEFDKALEDEIKAVKTRGGDRTLSLRDGNLIGEIAG